MCPLPIVGPQPHTGSSARSRRPASSFMPGNRSVSPGKYTAREPSTTHPIAGPVGPNGSRLPAVQRMRPPRSGRGRWSADRRAPPPRPDPGRPAGRWPPNPRGTMTVGRPGIWRRDARSRWSWWPWLMNTASRSANSSGRTDLHLAPDRAEAVPQHGVHQDPQVVHLDQDRGVAEERDAAVLRAGGIRPDRRRGRRATPGRRRHDGAAWRHGAANRRFRSPTAGETPAAPAGPAAGSSVPDGPWVPVNP